MVFQEQTMRQKRVHLRQFILSTGFRLGLIVLTVILMTLHIMKMSTLSTQGYKMSVLQKQIHQLEEETQQINSDIALSSSMNSIEERLRHLPFEPIEKPVYVTFRGSSVAQR